MNRITNKIYIVSLCAMQKSGNLLDKTKESIYWEHKPLLLTSTSMETAALLAEGAAFDSWKREDGWSNHSASISPVTSEFKSQLAQLIQQGIITLEDDPLETRQFFRFDENTDFNLPHSS